MKNRDTTLLQRLFPIAPAALVLLLGGSFAVSCGNAEEAGKEIDEAAEEAADELEDAADEVEDAVDDGTGN